MWYGWHIASRDIISFFLLAGSSVFTDGQTPNYSDYPLILNSMNQHIWSVGLSGLQNCSEVPLMQDQIDPPFIFPHCPCTQILTSVCELDPEVLSLAIYIQLHMGQWASSQCNILSNNVKESRRIYLVCSVQSAFQTHIYDFAKVLLM